MPSKAPPQGTQLNKALRQLGQQIRLRRKTLKVSAVVTSEAAGISRMTLNRIERGEASVTIGAYLNVISILGLKINLASANPDQRASKLKPPEEIRIADFPQLKRLAWQLKGSTKISAEEALDLYERNWRHLDQRKLNTRERELINALLVKFGRSNLLV